MTPEEKAKNVIEEYCFKDQKQLDIEAIAWAEFIAIEEIPMTTHIGRINFEDGYGLMSIKDSFNYAGQRNFTIAHELGHYFIEKESMLKKFSCSSKDLLSYKFGSLFEQKANEFAAELLMYKPWFSDFVRKRDINMQLIKDIADHFGVSLSAAAIRYAGHGRFPIAVIYSSKVDPKSNYGEVKWRSISEYFPLKWIPIGFKVSKDSPASDFFKGETMQEGADLVPASAWFSEDKRCGNSQFWEENIVMSKLNSVLTILWSEKKR